MSMLDGDVLYSGPHAASSERAVLAAALADQVALAEVAALTAEDFSQPLDALFTAFQEIHNDGLQPSRDLVRDRVLRGNPEGPEHGPALAVLDNLEPVATEREAVQALVEEIKVYSRRRNFASSLRKSVGRLLDGSRSIDDISSDVVGTAMDATSGRRNQAKFIDEYAREYEGGLDLLLDETKGPPPRATGFPGLDRVLGGGFRDGELVILGARPGAGKTSMALCITKNVLDQGRTVMMFSLEMPTAAITRRMTCQYANCSYDLIRRGPGDDDNRRMILRGFNTLRARRLAVDPSTAIDAPELVLRVKRMAQRHPVDFVVVDYVQLLQGRGENRNQEVANITRALKVLALDLNIPVLALSQLSRGIEGRRGNDRKPRLADLRDSGAIEQDADIVMFLDRKELYDQEAPRGGAEIIVSKQRNGELGSVPLFFRQELMRFESPSDRGEEDEPW